LLTGYVYFTALFTIPLRHQVVDLNTPIRSGVRLLPLVVATALGSLVSGGVSSRMPEKNITFWTMSIATTLMCVGTGLLSVLPADGSQTSFQYVWEAFLGFGVGMTISTITFVILIEAKLLDHGKLISRV